MMNLNRPIVAVARLMGTLSGALALTLLASSAAQTVIFSTGFEPEEGYNSEFDLTGQNGWIGDGADGLATNYFAGLGQQAYIGFSTPAGGTNDFFSVYRPLNVAPIPAAQPVVKFSVMMQIIDSTSTNGPWDDFRWSVYNTNGVRLFSLSFDNASLEVSYLLDDTAGFVSTGVRFDTLGYYDLEITMNFHRNLWTAALNDEVIVNAKPMTTVGSVLNLGDIAAVWSVRYPEVPGDNFLVFDEYTVTLEPADSIQPRLESLGTLAGGVYHARLYGEPGLPYRIEASEDLIHWAPLLTVTAPVGGALDFRDSTAPLSLRKFYRARQGTQ